MMNMEIQHINVTLKFGMWTTQKNILRNEYEYEDGAQLVNNTPKGILCA